MSGTLVIQSHRLPLPFNWLKLCINSVELWAENRGFDYRFLDNAIFDLVAADIRKQLADRPVILSDIARLKALQQGLLEGYQQVVWCDADFLIFDPPRCILPESDYALGREHWIQTQGTGQLRCYSKVHNAFLMFRTGNHFLDFYCASAESLVRRNQAAMPDQFVGPKLLTAIHNLIGCPVMETAAMFSPLVMRDILKGGGPAIALLQKNSQRLPAAANLCASLSEAENLGSGEMQQIIDTLRQADNPLTDRK
ncbi:MAG: hypothetical protein AAF353_16215 [Pseudomonadota bacterium]